MTQNSCCEGVFLPSEIFAKSSNFQLPTFIFTWGAVTLVHERYPVGTLLYDKSIILAVQEYIAKAGSGRL